MNTGVEKQKREEKFRRRLTQIFAAIKRRTGEVEKKFNFKDNKNERAI
jgi:hypothetical protein